MTQSIRAERHGKRLQSALACGLLAQLALGCDAYDEQLLRMRYEHIAAVSGAAAPIPAAIGGSGAGSPASAAAAGAAGAAGTAAPPQAGAATPPQAGAAAPPQAGAAGTAAPPRAGSPAGAAGGSPAGGDVTEAARCGDGVVQAAETCEPNSSTPCPSAADCDDHDACTLDVLRGSAAQCNAACTHDPVRDAKAGDGCCPAGANAGTDADCPAKCGNGVREGAEECDGSAGCSATCKLEQSPEQLQCGTTLAETKCEQCQCQHCATEMLACKASGNAARDSACSAVETCATEAQCAADACYCGTSPLATCEFFANGACRTEIEHAAGTGLALEIHRQFADPNTALGRAGNLGTCRRKYCATECK